MQIVRHAIDEIIRRLSAVNLQHVHQHETEPRLCREFAKELRADQIEFTRGKGVDGSVRTPDYACAIRDSRGEKRRIAIEYKLYRSRKTGAGEMDRGLGQCIAYAEQYEAVLFFVVYMVPPEHVIQVHWLKRGSPLMVGHKQPYVPIYFAARPKDWQAPWAVSFVH